MTHPLVAAVQPLLSRIGAVVVSPEDITDGDVPLRWEGSVVAGVRLTGEDVAASLERLIAQVESELGGPLRELPRAKKQRAVRLLEERGAFTVRKSAETVAQRLGVTRFTVYNYLNREG